MWPGYDKEDEYLDFFAVILIELCRVAFFFVMIMQKVMLIFRIRKNKIISHFLTIKFLISAIPETS